MPGLFYLTLYPPGSSVLSQMVNFLLKVELCSIVGRFEFETGRPARVSGELRWCAGQSRAVETPESMSFPKAPLKRFNDPSGSAPSPGAYDAKISETVKGSVSFQKSQ